MTRTALITGVTGQDGAYLAQYLLERGYVVHGIKRRASLFNTDRVDHLYQDPHAPGVRFFMHYGDLTDATNLIRVVQETRPDELYNLAAQSHVQVSFETAEYTANADALGTLRLLEALRMLGLESTTRFYQASTSEMFGLAQEVPQRETTPFYPRSPYGAAKLYAYWICVNYREAYGLHASNGILFNHESPIRGETFVTRKITRAVARVALGMQSELFLGNLDSLRDWGHARDFVRAMHLMLQQNDPDDYVIATGEQHSVREFCQRAFAEVGLVVEFAGDGADEVGTVASIDRDLLDRARSGYGSCPGDPDDYGVKEGSAVVRVDPRYFRPTEVGSLIGDSTKARERLGWSPTVRFEGLVHEMVSEDLASARRDALLRYEGFSVLIPHD
ncbi:MAG TPA: GDP-mannose 4,6-dehydratase [Thermoleophilia bacterium]|nr:GDP-mannose 4,6-dehydratase [Thermoleophilia bacterium]